MIAHKLNMCFCAHLNIFLGVLNLDMITFTPPSEYLHCLFVCDCSPIEDVHRRRRSIAESDLVSLCYKKETPSQGFP